jgi:hypothetical protein
MRGRADAGNGTPTGLDLVLVADPGHATASLDDWSPS